MIEESACVIEVGAGYALVEVQRASACASCHSQSSCGSAALAQVWGNKSLRTRAVSNLSLQPGDRVVVGMADGVLLRGALLVYLLPIVLLIAGALLAQLSFAAAGEELVVLCAALAFICGLFIVRVISQRLRHDPRFQAVVLRRSASLPSE